MNYLKFVFLTLIPLSIISFRSQTGFIDINLELNKQLNVMKNFLPINLLINAIEQYQLNTKELAFKLEACSMNLRGAQHFLEKDDFKEHQKFCLTDFFEFFSIFEVMRSMVFKFFSDTCPDELIDRCTPLIETFDITAQKIEELVYSFMNMLLKTDEKMETLDPLMAEMKAMSVETVVMKSLSAINQESFYNQLNEILQSKNEEIALEEISQGTGPVKTINKVNQIFTVSNSIQDDPVQNPDKYLLENPQKMKIKNLYVVFNNEDNEPQNQLIKL